MAYKQPCRDCGPRAPDPAPPGLGLLPLLPLAAAGATKVAAVAGAARAAGGVLRTIGGALGIGGGSSEPRGCRGYNAGAYSIASVTGAIQDPARAAAIADLMARTDWKKWPSYRERIRSGDVSLADWLYRTAGGTTGDGCSSGDAQMDALLSQLAPSSRPAIVGSPAYSAPAVADQGGSEQAGRQSPYLVPLLAGGAFFLLSRRPRRRQRR